MKPENRTQFINEIIAVGLGTFSKINGVTFGFSVSDDKCTMFDAAEVDDFREETFDSVEQAIDCFKIGKDVIADYIGKIEITPCQSV